MRTHSQGVIRDMVDTRVEQQDVEEVVSDPTVARDYDPREDIEVGVLMANGRLVGRTFASKAEAEAWARPDLGDQVVEFNIMCECSFTS